MISVPIKNLFSFPYKELLFKLDHNYKALIYHYFIVWIAYTASTKFLTVRLYTDGYTVSDVVMYWKDTPVRGVEDAELPQFTILGYETNDRKVCRR